MRVLYRDMIQNLAFNSRQPTPGYVERRTVQPSPALMQKKPVIKTQEEEIPVKVKEKKREKMKVDSTEKTVKIGKALEIPNQKNSVTKDNAHLAVTEKVLPVETEDLTELYSTNVDTEEVPKSLLNKSEKIRVDYLKHANELTHKDHIAEIDERLEELEGLKIQADQRRSKKARTSLKKEIEKLETEINNLPPEEREKERIKFRNAKLHQAQKAREETEDGSNNNLYRTEQHERLVKQFQTRKERLSEAIERSQRNQEAKAQKLKKLEEEEEKLKQNSTRKIQKVARSMLARKQDEKLKKIEEKQREEEEKIREAKEYQRKIEEEIKRQEIKKQAKKLIAPARKAGPKQQRGHPRTRSKLRSRSGHSAPTSPDSGQEYHGRN